MNILSRPELCELITGQKIINGVKINQDAQKDYTSDSSIQPCSLYLHVGEIYLPEQKENKRGSETNPIKGTHSLKPGEVIFVRTAEELNIPPDIGGICFAPAQFSLKGLLIVNIGHIDPGYKGKLHYTVVNLGKENFNIEENHPISKLLLFKLSQGADSRGPEKIIKIGKVDVPEAVVKSLPRLSRSFMDMDEITKKRVNTKFKLLTFLVPAISAALATAVAIGMPFLFNKYSAITELQKENVKLQTQIENMQENYDEDIKELLNKVSDLELLIKQE